MGTKLVGDHLSRGTKYLGTICPWGQEVGDQKSGDQMGSGPNESQPLTVGSLLYSIDEDSNTTLLVSRSEYPRDQSFLLTMVSYLKD